LGLGGWGMGPNPQSPIPNPQSPSPYDIFLINLYQLKIIFYYITYLKINKITINVTK